MNKKFLLTILFILGHNNFISKVDLTKISNNNYNNYKIKEIFNIPHWITYKIENYKMNHNIKFQLENFSWEYPWQGEDILGKPSDHYILININNKIVKVFLPSNITVYSSYNLWTKMININYTINKTHYHKFFKDDEKDDTIQMIINNNKAMNFDTNLTKQFQIETIENADTTEYRYNLKDNVKLMVTYSKEYSKRRVMEWRLFKNNKLITRQTFDENPNLHFDRYPIHDESNFYPSKKILKGMEDLFNHLSKNNFSNKIDVIITETIEFNKPLQDFFMAKLIKEHNIKKNYVLILVPLVKQIFPKYPEERLHIWPIGFLMKKINKTWYLEKIILTNSCMGLYFFIKNIFINFLGKLLKETQSSIYAHKPNDNHESKGNQENIMVINKADLSYQNNPWFFITDFFQLRQIGTTSCYTNVYKEMLKILDYSYSIIDNKNHFLDDCKIGFSDMIGKFSCYITYDDFTYGNNHYKNFVDYLEKSLLLYNSYVINNKINNNFLLIMEIKGPEDNGPLINEKLFRKIPKIKKDLENIDNKPTENNEKFHNEQGNGNPINEIVKEIQEYEHPNPVHNLSQNSPWRTDGDFSKELDKIRKYYYIFSIKINNDIFTYLIYRNKENTLDNEKFFKVIQETLSKENPQWNFYPMVSINANDFNQENSHKIVQFLFFILKHSFNLPCIYQPLYNGLPIFFEAENDHNNIAFLSLMIANTYKNLVTDYPLDIFFHIFYFLLKEDKIKNKGEIIKLLSQWKH